MQPCPRERVTTMLDWYAGLTQLVAQENKISVASDLFRTKILFDWLQQSEENGLQEIDRLASSLSETIQYFICGCGGIGIRARFRSVYLGVRVSSPVPSKICG